MRLSSTRQKRLAGLFGPAERRFFTNELIARIEGGPGPCGVSSSGRLKAAWSPPFRVATRNIFRPIRLRRFLPSFAYIVAKTFGLAFPLRHALAPLEAQIQAAFIFGSVAKQRHTVASDIDLMILGDGLSYADAMGAMADVEGRLGRHINPTIFTADDWRKRIAEKSVFATRVLAQPKIWLKGGEQDLPG